VGKVKVISIDYRQAPEYAFPAASEDVAAVYRQLLKTYKPKNIGIYGCSAGGLLTAQSIAWFQKEGLPLPGAVGMFCEGADYWTDGDFGYIGPALAGTASLGAARENPYFKDTNLSDPLAFPARSPQVMAKFPPSLLVTGTRDFALSSVVHTHALLVAQGVAADLHVWEGLGHAFFFDPDLPESQEVYAIAIKFFDTYLGR
jgi:acetyl esterase/lipase